jgi:hypothetical protein
MLDTLVSANKVNKVTIATANTATDLAATDLEDGVYRVYTVDIAGTSTILRRNRNFYPKLSLSSFSSTEKNICMPKKNKLYFSYVLQNFHKKKYTYQM